MFPPETRVVSRPAQEASKSRKQEGQFATPCKNQGFDRDLKSEAKFGVVRVLTFQLVWCRSTSWVTLKRPARSAIRAEAEAAADEQRLCRGTEGVPANSKSAIEGLDWDLFVSKLFKGSPAVDRTVRHGIQLGAEAEVVAAGHWIMLEFVPICKIPIDSWARAPAGIGDSSNNFVLGFFRVPGRGQGTWSISDCGLAQTHPKTQQRQGLEVRI